MKEDVEGYAVTLCLDGSEPLNVMKALMPIDHIRADGAVCHTPHDDCSHASVWRHPTIDELAEWLRLKGQSLDKFNLGKHVRVVNKDHPLFGKTGNVVCIAHHLNDRVWVDMDVTPPPNLIKFAGKYDSRQNWVIFNAEDCEAIT